MHDDVVATALLVDLSGTPCSAGGIISISHLYEILATPPPPCREDLTGIKNNQGGVYQIPPAPELSKARFSGRVSPPLPLELPARTGKTSCHS